MQHEKIACATALTTIGKTFMTEETLAISKEMLQRIVCRAYYDGYSDGAIEMCLNTNNGAIDALKKSKEYEDKVIGNIEKILIKGETWMKA